MTPACFRVPPLARPLVPEMSPVAFPYLLLPAVCEVAVPVTYDDSFFDDLGASLPPPSLLLLMPAAAWSARNSKSGFVPSWMIAKLSSDPERDTGPLFASGIARRGKSGGMHIVEGKGITIVNADDAVKQAERVKEQGRIRAQRKRDKDKAARAGAMTEAVTRDARVTSRPPLPDVTPAKRADRKKRQVSDEYVTRYEPGSSRVTRPPSRAGADQDLNQDQEPDDFDFELDPALVSQSSAVDAGAGAQGASDAELAEAVIEAVREREHFDLDPATALKVGEAAVARRKKGPPADRARYAATVIANEKDLYAKLLRGVAPPLAEIVAAPDLPPEVHPFRSDGALEPTCLTCHTKETNYRHRVSRQEIAS